MDNPTPEREKHRVKVIYQPEGSRWCGAYVTAMVLEHLGIDANLTKIKSRLLELAEVPEGGNFNGLTEFEVASILAEYGLNALHVNMGYPGVRAVGWKHYARSLKPLENRIYVWRLAYDMISQGYIAIVGYDRDAGKPHFVVVDDAFLRGGERWFSVACPIRGNFEEQAERFLLHPSEHDGGTGYEWIFVRRPAERFASAVKFWQATMTPTPTLISTSTTGGTVNFSMSETDAGKESTQEPKEPKE